MGAKKSKKSVSTTDQATTVKRGGTKHNSPCIYLESWPIRAVLQNGK